MAPALGPLLESALGVADAAWAPVVVALCSPKELCRVVVGVATTRLDGTDSDTEVMAAGRTVSERVVELGAADDVVSKNCAGVDEVEGVGVDLRTVVVLVVAFAGAMVERAVPLQLSGVIVVNTVR